MVIRNSKLIDEDNNILSICSFATVTLPQSLWWQADDIEQPTAIGSVFYGFEDDTHKMNGAADVLIQIVDVTNDSSEPDIAKMSHKDAIKFDELLKAQTEDHYSSEGVEDVIWKSSQLNESGNIKGLVTVFSVELEGRECVYITLRTSITNRKYVVVGMYDIAKENRLAPIINETICRIHFNNNN